MELIPVEEVAKELHTAHRAVVKAILKREVGEMEERELMMECPICKAKHDGPDELCEDCLRRVDRAVKRIQSARDALVTDMLIEAAGANETLMRIIEEGLKNEIA